MNTRILKETLEATENSDIFDEEFEALENYMEDYNYNLDEVLESEDFKKMSEEMNYHENDYLENYDSEDIATYVNHYDYE